MKPLMVTVLDEPIEIGDVILVAHGHSASYAKVRAINRKTCSVSFLAPPTGDAWLSDMVTAKEEDLLFKLNAKQIKEMDMPK